MTFSYSATVDTFALFRIRLHFSSHVQMKSNVFTVSSISINFIFSYIEHLFHIKIKLPSICSKNILKVHLHEKNWGLVEIYHVAVKTVVQTF